MKNDKRNDDSIAQLRLENDIMKLSMQAQFGAKFSGSDDQLPPEIEHQFLQNVQKFEEAWQDVSYITVYDLLNRPDFKLLENLSPPEIEPELTRIKNLLEEKQISLVVPGQYESSTIYRFITEELFEQETEDIQLPGYVKTFVYEEFHPNHKMDIEGMAQLFLGNWFRKNFDQFSTGFNHEMISDEGKRFSNEEIFARLNNNLAQFRSFSNEKYEILDSSFEWDAAKNTGMAHVEGLIEYNAQTQSGKKIHIAGPFKFYLCNEYGYWNMFYFVFPGFQW